MHLVNDYYPIALENEAVFRNILRDLRDHRHERPAGLHVPEDLDSDSPLEQIFEKYSEGIRYGRFTIFDFERPDEESARISFECMVATSGQGAQLEYRVKEDTSVEFGKEVLFWRR